MSIPWSNLKRIQEYEQWKQANPEATAEEYLGAKALPDQRKDPFYVTHSIGSLGNWSENLLFWLVMLKLSQTPRGMEIVGNTLEGIVSAFEKALSGYCRAGAANKVSAWASGRLLSQFMERFGFITQMQAAEFNVGISIISGAVIAEGYLDTIQGFMPFTHPEPSDFPSQVDLGDDLSIKAVKGRSAKEVKELLAEAKALKSE